VDALVLIHLDSLASFHSETGEGKELASALEYEARTHRGPVIGVVQGWDERIARGVVRAIEARDDGLIVEFDEDVSDWDEFLPELLRDVRSMGADSVTVGGVWFDPSGRWGCVNTAADYLSRQMPVVVDGDLVGSM
jgi:hypothetical protein